MAGGTRFQELARSTDAQIHENAGTFKDSIARVDGRINAIEEKMGGLQRSMAEMNSTLQGIMIGGTKFIVLCFRH